MAQPPVETSPPDPVVSPRLFLKYFTKSTNSPASGGAPQDFSPPKTAGPPPDGAADSTGP
jgi:hypothetical protein